MNFYDDIHVYQTEPALILEDQERVSYARLVELADSLTLPRRSLVFSLCENSLPSVAGYIGCLRARAVPVMISSTINPELFEKLLATYRPAFIWTPRATARNWGTEVHSIGHYVLLATGFDGAAELHPDLALLLTTSGSTGSPKLVRQSYRNIESNAAAIADYLGITQGDRPITTLPMSYTYGLSIINSHLLKGCPIILTDRSLMDKAFWEQLKSNEASTFGGVPYSYEILKKLRFARMDLPSLKTLTQAGGKLNAELAKEYATQCAEKGVRFITMYGQAEATARMSWLPPENAIAKAGSIGIAIPGGRFWLEDEHGNKVSDVGELVYAGDNVTMGYAETRADLARGDDNGGVLHTGDMASVDADGYYTIVGRKKRFLKLFGNRVNLEEMEQLLAGAGHVCACAGRDDHLVIYTTDADGHAEMRKFAAERTGIHPSAFAVVRLDAIPRNEAGKILYSALEHV